MTQIIVIKIAEQFTDAPGAAFKHEGPWSGEQFCEEILLPTFQQNPKAKIEIDFDGLCGCIYAFPYQAVYTLTKGLIEEALNGMEDDERWVVKNRVIADIQNRLIVTTREMPDLIYPIVDGMDDAASDCKVEYDPKPLHHVKSVTNPPKSTKVSSPSQRKSGKL